ncbi:MAG: xanthine dehydrogenase family protein subunit M [Streptosporangiales bacterium]|nr:xanthine dehydrogenase family protein subunit M [Streptosporangiales bacterium]
MKPAPFRLERVRSVDECLDALTGDDVKVIAGGQSLIPLMALRLADPRLLVDVNGVTGLDGVAMSGGYLYLGSLVRHTRLATDERIGGMLPLLREAASHIGHVAIRNRGTLGGSLAHADAAAELPAAMVLLGATMVCVARRGGRREIPAAEFFVGPYTTALRDDELLAGVRVPVPAADVRFGFVEFAPRHGDFARAGCACAVEVDEGGRLAGLRAVVFAVTSCPVDVARGAALPFGEPVGDVDWRGLARALTEDVRASAGDEHRARLAPVAVERAIRQAIGGVA